LQKDILPIDFLFFHLKIKRLQKFFNTLSDRLAIASPALNLGDCKSQGANSFQYGM
jgi:hypothetical protein